MKREEELLPLQFIWYLEQTLGNVSRSTSQWIHCQDIGGRAFAGVR